MEYLSQDSRRDSNVVTLEYECTPSPLHLPVQRTMKKMEDGNAITATAVETPRVMRC